MAPSNETNADARTHTHTHTHTHTRTVLCNEMAKTHTRLQNTNHHPTSVSEESCADHQQPHLPSKDLYRKYDGVATLRQNALQTATSGSATFIATSFQNN